LETNYGGIFFKNVMVNWGGYALEEAEKSLAVGPNENFEGVQRFRDNIRHFHKRWDNKLVLEHCSLREGYFNGRFEIVLYIEAFVRGADKCLWLVRVPACGQLPYVYAAYLDILAFDLREPDHGDEVIMFVGIAQTSGSPKIEIRVPAWFIFFDMKSAASGKAFSTFLKFPEASRFCRSSENGK